MINFMVQLLTEGTALSCEVIGSQQQVTVPQQISAEKTTANSVNQCPKTVGRGPRGSPKGTTQGLSQELPRRVTMKLRLKRREVLPTGL